MKSLAKEKEKAIESMDVRKDDAVVEKIPV